MKDDVLTPDSGVLVSVGCIHILNQYLVQSPRQPGREFGSSSSSSSSSSTDNIDTSNNGFDSRREIYNESFPARYSNRGMHLILVLVDRMTYTAARRYRLPALPWLHS